jgi:hypothetical protein
MCNKGAAASVLAAVRVFLLLPINQLPVALKFKECERSGLLKSRFLPRILNLRVHAASVLAAMRAFINPAFQSLESNQ